MNAYAGKKKTALNRAAKLFKQRQFGQVVRVLEPQITSYRESSRYFYFLGSSCLYTGDYGGADVYLRRCAELDRGNIGARLGLAVVFLRRGENEESLRIWLDVLQEDPKNRYARLGLETARKYSQEDDGNIDEFFESRKDLALVPSPGFYLPRWAKWLIAVLLLGAFVLFPAALIVRNKLNAEPEFSRPEIAAVEIETDDAVLAAGRARDMMTKEEVRGTFDNIKKFLDNWQDNFALREINRLQMSNASQTVKDKALSLVSFIRTPTFADFSESFTYEDVTADPLIYEGCFVRWKGRIANINIEPNRITFDFLAGYQDQKVLLERIPSWMEFAANLEPEFAYEIIARVSTQSGANKIALQIISLHKLSL